VRNIDLKKEFGASIRERRKQLGLSQEALAERADLHRTYVSDIENGLRNISLENIHRLSRALEISLSLLFARVESGAKGSGPANGSIARRTRS
jgi:transcriptional regulator with XRE-family HTH domain